MTPLATSSTGVQASVRRPVKAVFPLGGLGTRRLPASKTIPTEMMPVLDKPLIQYAVEEAYASGFREMLFVTGHNLRSVEDHFDLNLELERQLEQAKQTDLLDLVRAITPGDMACAFVRQPRPLGIANALLCVEHLLENEPFAVLLPQELWVGAPPVLQQLVETFERTQRSVVGVSSFNSEFLGTSSRLRPLDVSLAVSGGSERAGRCVFGADLFRHLKNQRPEGEHPNSFGDAILRLAAAEGVDALLCDARRYDCGTREGHLRATVDLALSQEDLAADLVQLLSAGGMR